MNRREFAPMVYAEIVRRAMLPDGQIACEGCGLILKSKKYHVDHTIADALLLDKKRKLTAKDGKLLGIECCHAPKTAVDVAAIAKAKRCEARHLSIKRPKQTISSAPFPASDKAKRVGKTPLAPRRLYQETQA